ncbi:Asp23/Gls24 family envelope stress response protein [Gemmiger formicilis]|nr:Asp23/Gls24 family envelope stress response protein [Gemmiger formicilis]
MQQEGTHYGCTQYHRRQLTDLDRGYRKIARLAALEVDGVADVATGTSQNVRSLLGRTGLQKPVTVVMEDGIATVTVHLTVVYGSKVMPLCEKVQENVKQTIQNMTGITVSRVDVLVVGLTDAAEKSKGNTAQFPPYGLSAAPAAAARHLRCQNAR